MTKIRKIARQLGWQLDQEFNLNMLYLICLLYSLMKVTPVVLDTGKNEASGRCLVYMHMYGI